MSKKTKKITSKKDEEKFIEEEDNKIVLIVIAIITIIIGIVIGLLVGCQKEEKPEDKGTDIIIPTNDKKDKEEEIVEEIVEETQSIKTTVTKTSTKTEEKKSYVVTFYYNDNLNSHRVRVEEGNKVTRFMPGGFDSCTYEVNGKEFNFNTTINSNIDIIMYCENITEYKVVYHYDTNLNEVMYDVLDGEVAVAPYTATQGIFDGWYTEDDVKISVINKDIINYADSNNEIHLYPLVTTYEYNVYDSFENMVVSEEITKVEDLDVETPDKSDNYCDNATHLGWTKTQGTKVIDYDFKENITLDADLTLYAVCGSAVVIYNSEGETTKVGYTEEELDPNNPDGYNLPDTKEELEEIGIETPTYFIPVEEVTDTSKEVVEDDREYIADNQITITEVSNNAAEGYTPAVGDNVEEIEKELEGWTTEDTDPTSETVGEQIPVEEEFVPEVDTETELNAEWVEPIPYEQPQIEM